ncbi:MAG: peptidoglycan editing factor PgeF [Burkholderiaceae bacterium]|nr:peptidoglycan editing factor PgeF [Burkholderiaceae bacterium]MDO9090275.1 peptidoglycan editing factor PgeF [Burkholderiaceae bacterium]
MAGLGDAGQSDWLTPDWPAPPRVHAVCTTRKGGVSAAPWHSFNLGDHVGDDPAAVQANRTALAGALGARPVFLQQIHQTAVVTLHADTPDGTQADGCVTSQRGVACTIMVADCLPVLLCDTRGRAVAAAHAGWRGLAGGILEATHARLLDSVAAPAPQIMAWLGPCIGPGAFEVGPEVRAVFEAQDPQAHRLFLPGAPGKWLADLPGLARRRLQAMGVTRIHGNDGSAPWCTVGNPSRFFSHRRDRISGRFAAGVWLD